MTATESSSNAPQAIAYYHEDVNMHFAKLMKKHASHATYLLPHFIPLITPVPLHSGLLAADDLHAVRCWFAHDWQAAFLASYGEFGIGLAAQPPDIPPQSKN